MDSLTDEQLVTFVLKKDRELYGEIIRRYEKKLAHYLQKFIHDRDELEDILQDVFIKAYRNLNNFDVQKRFLPWIYRIAHNEAINFIKKYSKEVISIDQSEWDVIDKSLEVSEKVDRVLLKKKIEEGLSKMKLKYREPLMLFFFEGRSYEEIGDILLMPTNTVGTLIRRGKNILKIFLDK